MLTISIALSSIFQLVVMFIAHILVNVYGYLSLIVTTARASCKWMDALEEEFYYYVLYRLERGEISSGKSFASTN